MHKATFENWNGKLMTISFKSTTTKWAEMCKKAHAAILKAGYTTVRLVSIDNDPVEYQLAYR